MLRCMFAVVIPAFLLQSASAQVIEYLGDERFISAFNEDLGTALIEDTINPSPLVPGTYGPFSGIARSSLSGTGAAGISSAQMTSQIGLLRMQADAQVNSLATAFGGTGYAGGTANFQVRFRVNQPTAYTLSGMLSGSYGATSFQGEVRVIATLARLAPFATIESADLLADAGDPSPAPQAFTGAGILAPGEYEIMVWAEARNSELEDETSFGDGAFTFTLDLGDRDGDGLADAWEQSGIDINGDGIVEIDLPALGADPDRKDLFVEIDAMQGRAPSFGVAEAVRAAFAAAPVENPDGSTGITLHLLVDETDIPRVAWPDAWAGFDVVKAQRYATAAERARPDWPEYRQARMKVYRYCVFADTIFNSSISGISELPGDDFVVSLGAWPDGSGGFGGTTDEQAGTFMHELGHALGLRHGGADDIHHKPNYFSVMNYLWQTPNGYAGWRLSYSEAAAPTLRESALIEADGTGAPEYGSVQTPIGLNGTPAGPTLRRFIFVPMNASAADWNGDGRIDALVTDQDPTYQLICPSTPPPAGCFQLPSPGEVLRGHNDWANLHYGLGNAPDFADGVRLTPDLGELTAEIDAVYNAIVNPQAPCATADLAEPFGLLDLADVVAFAAAFLAMNPTADLAEPFGLLDLADISAFVSSFTAGCP